MTQIRVTRGGCGISYEDEYGTRRHALKTPDDGPFMCDDAQAARLIRLGVAACVSTPKVQQGPEKTMYRFDENELESWEYNQLKKLAADLGVTPNGRKKADLIAAITTVEVDPGIDIEPGESDNGEDDDLPELGAADPE